MLTITIDLNEVFDESTQTFGSTDSLVVQLEHSLISLSKWESKYGIPFLGATEKTHEQTFDYIMHMVITPGITEEDMYKCSKENLSEIQSYIDSAHSATTFGEMPKRRGPSEVITSELIYYWMVAFKIPFECQHWHLNRLFALIRICNIKNQTPTKKSRTEIARMNREINAKRREELGTSG